MDVFGLGRAQRGRSSENGPVGPPKVLTIAILVREGSGKAWVVQKFFPEDSFHTN